jgi:dienelactone hydrolase
MLIAVSTRVREDGVIGTLVEPTEEPRGAVVVLGGSTGGMDETVATALAEAGFVSLALAYFGVTGLPERLAEIPVETVARGILWLRDHPSVGRLRVGLVGASKGGELALLAASLLSEHLSALAVRRQRSGADRTHSHGAAESGVRQRRRKRSERSPGRRSAYCPVSNKRTAGLPRVIGGSR